MYIYIYIYMGMVCPTGLTLTLRSGKQLGLDIGRAQDDWTWLGRSSVRKSGRGIPRKGDWKWESHI